MPKYRFRWEAIPPDVLAPLAVAADCPGTDPCEELRSQYGARPKENFVQDLWPSLRDDWLSSDSAALSRIVDALRSAGLGKTEEPNPVEYLRSVRNSKTMRGIVLSEFRDLGEPHDRAESTPHAAAEAKPEAADSPAKIGRPGRKHVGFNTLQESPEGRQFINDLVALVGEPDVVALGKVRDTHIFAAFGDRGRALIAEQQEQRTDAEHFHSLTALRTDSIDVVEITIEMVRWDAWLAFDADEVRKATRSQRKAWDDRRVELAANSDTLTMVRRPSAMRDEPLLDLSSAEVHACWQLLSELAPEHEPAVIEPIEEPHETPAAEPPGDELDLVQRPWVTEELDDPAAAAQLTTMVLDEIQGQLQMDDEWVAREPSRLRWWGGPIPLTVDASVARSVFGDPTVKVVIDITLATDVRANPNVVLAMTDISCHLASLGAFVWLEEQAEIRAFTTFYAHPGNLSALWVLPMAALLTYTEALDRLTDGELVRIAEGVPAVEAHPITGERSDYDEMLGFTDTVVIPKGAEPCAWNDDEFTSVLSYMEQMGFFANGGAGFAVEYPFTSSMPAAVQAGLDTHPGGQTALYQQLTASPHPGYGQGLFSRLQLPIGNDQVVDRTVTNELNKAELLGFTGTPAWGAWCTGGQRGGVNHVMFLPNLMHRPGLADTVAFYEYMRSQWAQEQLLPDDVVRDVRAGRR